MNMNVAKHLLNDIKPLGLRTVVREVLDLMEELKFGHLPIVDETGHYLGVICEDDLLEIENEDDEITVHIRFIKPYFLISDQHVLDAVKLCSEAQLSLIPVVDKEQHYLGYISCLELIQDLGNMLSFKEEGGLLVLEIPSIDYQLSQITQIVESEDARIIGFLVGTSDKNIDTIEVNLKINQKDLGRIIKSFERYGYTIKQVFHTSIFDDSAEQRYELLMRYLNV